jgi:ATP-binding cassette subfamily C protein CydC
MIWLSRLVGPRALLLAVVAAVLADLAGVTLTGAAIWLLVRAAQRPQLAALSLGIAGVRAAAITRGLARYGERLAGHDAALGALAGLRERVYRALAGQVRPYSANALGAVVHDVDVVQDLVVRCVVPFAGALLVSATSTAVVWWLSPSAGPVLAGGLLVGLAVVSAVAGLRSRRPDRLIATDPAALTSRVVDLCRGAAELAVIGTGASARDDVVTAGARLADRQRSAPALGATAAALLDVDLRLPPGRRVAVVGASGSGKSTLLATVARFTEPAAGRISLGGTELAAWPESQLRATVGGVLADAHVFHDTIAANLRIGRPDATDAELVAMARRTRLLSWVESLPERWHTVLGEDAALASGGQRQRLLLARALLADPPVLLLDEPTEGMDARTADAVLADVLAATVGHTVVLVTHRLTGLAAFDEVLLLGGGRVRQRGPHRELALRPGPYRDLWRIRELIEP